MKSNNNNNNNGINLFLSFSLFSITILSSLVLSSSVSYADNDPVVDEINVTIPISCTLSGVGMNSHTATMRVNETNSSIGTTTITASCNDSEGFSIYAIGYTDDTDGKTVLTSSTLGSTHDIITGTATSGNTSNWAMKLSPITSPVPTYPITIAGSTTDTDKVSGDPDFTSFQEVPDDYTKVAYRKTGTDIGASSEGSSFTTTYQAYINSTQAAGTYIGQVKYTMVHPYNAAAPEKPLACNPSGTTIGTNTDTDIVCMQDISSSNKSSIMSSMTTGEQYQLYDIRDEHQYFVAKQADGNIWMTQNLDLCIGCEGTAVLTSENTDLNILDSNTYNNGYSESNGIITWTPALATSSSSVSVDSLSNYQYTDLPYSAEAGELYFYPSGNRDTIYSSESDCNNAHSEGMCPHYHAGNYYNFSAAIASNTGYYDLLAKSLENSICPAGWRLPNGGLNTISDNEFVQLLQSSTNVTNDYRNSPLFFTIAGAIEWAGSSVGYDTFGVYHTSLKPSDYLTFGIDNYHTGNRDDDGDRGNAYSIRCIVR